MGRELRLTDQGLVEFYEGTAGGTSKITVQGPSTLAGDYTLTLPTAQAGASEFLQNNGSGVLSWATGTATLDSAYTSGNKIDADGTEVEIEVANAQGNVALLLDQDDDQHALSVTKDGTGAGSGLNVVNAGTGSGLDIQNTSTGKGIFLNQDGAGIALDIDLDADAVALNVDVFASSTSDAVSVLNAGTGKGIFINQDGAAIGLDVDQDGGAVAVQINQGSANTALDVTQQAAGAVLNFACGAATGITGIQSNNNAMLDFTKSGTGSGIMINFENDGTGDTLVLDVDGNAKGLVIDSEATDAPLIELQPLSDTNERGDIAFTARAVEPATPTSGDVWYHTNSDGRSSLVMYIDGYYRYMASEFGPSWTTAESKTIASGVISTIASSHIEVNAETGTTDTLDTLINVSATPHVGATVVLRAASGDTITVAHGTGNIYLDGSANKSLSSVRDLLTLFWDGSDWIQQSFSNNG